MVAVGDQCLVPSQVHLDGGDLHGVRDRPQAVAEAVLRGRREERGKLDGPVDDVSGTAGAGLAPVTEQQGL